MIFIPPAMTWSFSENTLAIKNNQKVNSYGTVAANDQRQRSYC
jgi:hypothetical protein